MSMGQLRYERMNHHFVGTMMTDVIHGILDEIFLQSRLLCGKRDDKNNLTIHLGTPDSITCRKCLDVIAKNK